MQTPNQYYNDENSHGASQYVPLQEIIDAMEMEAMNNDSYIKNVSRFNLIRYAKDAIRKANTSTTQNKLAFEITVPNNLTVVLPPDFVDYLRVSKVEMIDGSNHLVPLDVNYNINSALAYLQDSEARLIFDDQGEVITADGNNGFAKPYRSYAIRNVNNCGSNSTDTSKYSKNGEFTIDKKRGKILFGSELMGRDVVIEYVSDGLKMDDSKISVHKHLKETVENWIYFAAIERGRNVPANEKRRALDRYKATYHKSLMDLADIKIYRLFRR